MNTQEQRKSPRAPGRALIIKPSSLGDVVAAIPVLRSLRRTFPHVHIAWLVNSNCAAAIRHDSDLDEVIIFERSRLGRSWYSPPAAMELNKLLKTLRNGAFDWTIDLQGLLRSGLLSVATGSSVRAGFADGRECSPWFYTHRISPSTSHTIDRNIALACSLGMDARPEDLSLQVAQNGLAFAERMERSAGLKRGDFLVCVPPTRWTTKLYPVRHWRTVVKHFAAQLPVAVLGTPSDRDLCASIADGMGASVTDLAGKTGIEEMVGLIAASAGVICSDSAAKFIAPAVGVDATVIIGPTRVELTGPYLKGRAVVADVPCAGCLKKYCRHVTCMQLISPDSVMDTARRMLAERGRTCR